MHRHEQRIMRRVGHHPGGARHGFTTHPDLTNEMAALCGPGGRRHQLSRFGRNLPIDIEELDEAYVITAEMPGVEPEKIDISVSENVLTIEARQSEEEVVEDRKFIQRERREGELKRRLRFSSRVDAEGIKATHKNGVLVVTLPKATAAQVRKVDIELG